MEISHLGPTLLAADRCLKSTPVRLVAIENSDSGELCLKLAGDTAAVTEAARVGEAAALQMGASVVWSVIPAPAPAVGPILLAPPIFNPLLGIYDAYIPRENGMESSKALGMVETQGLVALLHAVDVMLKTSNVEVVGKEKIGGGLVTVFVRGELAAVQAAVEAGARTVEKLNGKLILADVISNPHPELVALLPVPVA